MGVHAEGRAQLERYKEIQSFTDTNSHRDAETKAETVRKMKGQRQRSHKSKERPMKRSVGSK